MIADVTVQGIEKFTRRLDGDRVKDFTTQSITRVGNFVETAAKKNIKISVYNSPASPYYQRSGKAQQSIAFSGVINLEGKVTVGVKYGKYLEDGTGIPAGRTGWLTGQIPGTNGIVYIPGMKARPYWRPSVQQGQEEAPDIMKQLFNTF